MTMKATKSENAPVIVGQRYEFPDGDACKVIAVYNLEDPKTCLVEFADKTTANIKQSSLRPWKGGFR